ncbi:fatty acid synthase [Trichonephila clavipes]|nr:fatty acid synthase [Trichonephila clavipes]
MVNPKSRSSRWISSSHNESEWNNSSAKLADASYFVHNLVSPILLHQAFHHVPKDSIVIEISPHALSRYLISREIEHIRLLEEGVDPTASVLSCIGSIHFSKYKCHEKNSLLFFAIYHIHHIWHYRERLHESGQPNGRLRKTCKNAFRRTIPVNFG